MRRALIVLALIACGKSAPSVVKAAHDRLAVTLTAGFPGANANEMATQVANPLEDAVSKVDGLVRLHSRSTDGATTVVAEFPAEADGYAVSQKVFEAVKAARSALPDDLPAPPLVMRGSRAGAVMRVLLRSDRLSLGEVTAVARRLADKLAEVAGVERVEACGTMEPARTIQIDPVALAARGKTVVDLVTNIRGWALAPMGEKLDDFDAATIDSQARPSACLALDVTARFVALTVIPRASADALEVRRQLEAALLKSEGLLPATVHLEQWPRARPLAFEVRFPPGLARDVQVARLQQALPRTGQVLAELGVTSALAPDPDAADIRILAPETEAGAIKAALAQHELTVLDATDHVVGFSGSDPKALQDHAAAVADAIARTPGLHVLDELGLKSTTTTQLEIDRDAAARLGITTSDATLVLRALAPGGTVVATTNGVEPADVFVTIAGDPTDALQTLRLGRVPLSMVVRASRTSEPTVVFHEGRMPWVGLRVGGPLGALNDALAKLRIPAGIQREVREPD